MRRQRVMLLGELFDEFLKSEGLEKGIERIRVFEAWDEVVGEKTAQLTLDKFLKEGRLFCRISTAVARNRVFIERQIIVDKINNKLGEKVVKEIIVR